MPKKVHFIENFSLLEALSTDMLLSISLKRGGKLMDKDKIIEVLTMKKIQVRNYSHPKLCGDPKLILEIGYVNE